MKMLPYLKQVNLGGKINPAQSSRRWVKDPR
jgi:hypothetical protein